MRSKVTIFTLNKFVKFGPRLEHLEWNELFEKEDVQAVINMQREDTDVFQNSPLMYTWLPSRDSALSPETMNIGSLIIQNLVSRRIVTYVHCRAGVNRAPQMIVAFLIREGHSIEDAVERVKKVRTKFNPNENVMLAFQSFVNKLGD